MSTGNLPNPPDTPTSLAPSQAAEATTQPSRPADTTAPLSPESVTEEPFDLASDLARVFTEQADVLAQRLVYHTQLLYGVGAMPVDIVNARNSVLVVANALRHSAEELAVHSLVSVGTPQHAQVNDQTLPFKNNAQVAGLLEGLLLDVATRAYGDDPARGRDARLLLDSIFQSANEDLQRRSRALGPVSPRAAMAPGPDPNARS